jgi:glutamyl-tRNA reductase
VQSNTIISKGAASVAHAAVLKIRQKIEGSAEQKILIFGVGEIGQRTLENLKNQSSADITVVNRTLETAQKLSQQFDTKYAPISELKKLINQSQVVIVATASKDYTISAAEVQALDSKTLFIDLSVPRNIDPMIANHQHIELIAVDALNLEADQTLNKRKKDIPKAKTIINLFQMEFEDWLKLHRLGPVIKKLEHYFEDLKTKEIKTYQRQYEEEELQKVKPLIDSIVKKITSKNIEYLRKRYRYNDDILEVIKEMYKLN